MANGKETAGVASGATAGLAAGPIGALVGAAAGYAAGGGLADVFGRKKKAAPPVPWYRKYGVELAIAGGIGFLVVLVITKKRKG